MEKKKKKIYVILSVLLCITIILATVGITYAYFTATVRGNDNASSMDVNTMKVASIDFTDGGDITIVNAVPGMSSSKTFNVKIDGTNTIPMGYKVFLYWMNDGITDINYSLSKNNVKLNPIAVNSVVSSYQKTEIASGSFAPNKGAQTDVYDMVLTFPETGGEQNSQQGKNFKAYLQVELESGKGVIYFTADFPNGTTVKPEAPRLFKSAILADNTVVQTVANDTMFVTPASTNEGFWKEERPGKTENNLPVYFYRGSVNNNYVSFIGKMWRIIRINENNSIRLILDDTIGNSSYNTGDLAGTGNCYFMNGLDSSTIKSSIDAWYLKNITGANAKKLSDEVFCNDLTGQTMPRIYGGAQRLENANTPQFICANKADKYTINNTIGNGRLVNPIGLITADEVVYAGGVYNKPNSTFYLNKSGINNFWTMTPHSYDGTDDFVFNALPATTSLFASVTGANMAVRPVISLKDDIMVSGKGTFAMPYIIK